MKRTWEVSHRRQRTQSFSWVQRCEQTGPGSFDGPLVEEDEFAFSVVDGSLALDLAHVRDLAEAIFIFHTHSEKKLVQDFLWPGSDITLCPIRTFNHNILTQLQKYWHPAWAEDTYTNREERIYLF